MSVFARLHELGKMGKRRLVRVSKASLNKQIIGKLYPFARLVRDVDVSSYTASPLRGPPEEVL